MDALQILLLTNALLLRLSGRTGKYVYQHLISVFTLACNITLNYRFGDTRTGFRRHLKFARTFVVQNIVVLPLRPILCAVSSDILISLQRKKYILRRHLKYSKTVWHTFLGENRISCHLQSYIFNEIKAYSQKAQFWTALETPTFNNNLIFSSAEIVRSPLSSRLGTWNNTWKH